jgi:hypothetical protein
LGKIVVESIAGLSGWLDRREDQLLTAGLK